MRARLLATVLALTLVGACSEDEQQLPERRTSLTPESTAEPGDGGALDAVDGRVPLDTTAIDTFASGLVLDPDGEPVVLVGDGNGGGVELMRPTRADGWTTLPATTFGEGANIAHLLGATTAGVLVVVERAGRPALCRVASDAAVTCMPVPGVPDGATIASGLLAPDGASLFLLSGPAGAASTVTSHDPATGAVRASAAAPADRLVGLAGTDLVFLETGTVQESRAEISRLSSDLQPKGAVELDASYVQSAGGVEETVYASRLVNEESGSFSEVSLLALPEGAADAETVWSIPDAYLLAQLGAPVVDPEGSWVYLPTEQVEPGGVTSFLRLTPVDVATGEAAGSVTLCDGLQFGGMAIAPDGDRAFVVVRCADSDVPTLVTLR